MNQGEQLQLCAIFQNVTQRPDPTSTSTFLRPTKSGKRCGTPKTHTLVIWFQPSVLR